MKFRVNEKNMFYGADSQTFEAATILRKNMTLPELILWKRLKNKKLFNTKFRRQHPINIFIVDFYCHELKLAIEIDGYTHDYNFENDIKRQDRLESLGIRIVRFTDVDVLKHLNDVLRSLQAVIIEIQDA